MACAAGMATNLDLVSTGGHAKQDLQNVAVLDAVNEQIAIAQQKVHTHAKQASVCVHMLQDHVFIKLTIDVCLAGILAAC